MAFRLALFFVWKSGMLASHFLWKNSLVLVRLTASNINELMCGNGDYSTDCWVEIPLHTLFVPRFVNIARSVDAWIKTKHVIVLIRLSSNVVLIVHLLRVIFMSFRATCYGYMLTLAYVVNRMWLILISDLLLESERLCYLKFIAPFCARTFCSFHTFLDEKNGDFLEWSRNSCNRATWNSGRLEFIVWWVCSKYIKPHSIIVIIWFEEFNT